MKKRMGALMLFGLLTISTLSSAREVRYDLNKYEEILEKMYSYVNIQGKAHELEYELKDLDNFMVMVVEIEDDFFSNIIKDIDEKALIELEMILEEAAYDVKKVYGKSVRAIAEYEGKNLLVKRY